MLIRISLILYFLAASYAIYAQDNILYLNNNNSENAVNKVVKEQELLDEAIALLRRSKSDLAIEKLFQLLEIAGLESKIIDKINISIADGYRQRQEFEKGLNILYETIAKPEISAEDKTHAYTRIAAIYNEGNIQNINRIDSVIKYSNLAIVIAEQYNYLEHLATSQNELGFIYWRRLGEYQKAIDLLSESLANFLSIKRYPDAACVAFNISSAYADDNDYLNAEKTIDEALTYCELKGNENLFMRLYFQKSKVSMYKQEYKTAYEYLFESRELYRDYFTDKLDEKIFEMSAKYAAEKKEKENLELRKNNEIQSLKISHKNSIIFYLIEGVVVTIILLIIIYFLFRKQSIAYKNLLVKNLEIAQCDKKILESGDLTSERLQHNNENAGEKELEIINNFNKYIGEEKPYLYSNITIEDVAARIGSNRTYLSKAINEFFNKSFNSIINEFRIRAARQIMIDSKFDHLSLQAIAEMVGYSSRTSFISNFKKATGLTPSYFRKSIKDQ